MLPVNKSGHKLKIKRAVQAWTPQRQAPYGVSSVSTAGGGAAPDTAPLPHTPVMQAVVVSPSSTFTGAAPVAAAVVRNDAAAQPAGQPPPPYVAQPQPQPQPGMCARCGVRPAFTNRQTGQRHDYCGKRCAGEALAGLGMPPGGAAPKPHHQPQQPQQQMCAACGVNPANLPHLFCSRRCAGTQQVAGGGAGGSMAAGSVPPVGAAPSLSVMHRKADPGMCRFCNAQPAMQGHPFCGRRCKNRATEAGWVKGNPPDLATCFAQLEPELTQVLFASVWPIDAPRPLTLCFPLSTSCATSILGRVYHFFSAHFATAGVAAGETRRNRSDGPSCESCRPLLSVRAKDNCICYTCASSILNCPMLSCVMGHSGYESGRHHLRMLSAGQHRRLTWNGKSDPRKKVNSGRSKSSSSRQGYDVVVAGCPSCSVIVYSVSLLPQDCYFDSGMGILVYRFVLCYAGRDGEQNRCTDRGGR